MGGIAVHEFISLDGVFEDPRWTFEFGFDPEMGEAIGELTGRCEALLLGRTTYEMFAPAWSTRTVEDDPGATFFNDSTKYVVGTHQSEVAWAHTQHLGPYDPDAIRSLKQETSGDLYVSGSGTLVRAMLADSLVDELHLFVYPVALGAGGRLWREGADRLTLRLEQQQTYANGVVHLHYSPAGVRS